MLAGMVGKLDAAALETRNRVGPRRATTAIAQTSIWYQIFADDLPEDKVAWIQVELLDGTRVTG
jgi:hypothetical protein